MLCSANLWTGFYMIRISVMKELMTIYKSFEKPDLDYGDIILVEAYNFTLHQKLESFQCNAVLATRGAIRGTSKEKL